MIWKWNQVVISGGVSLMVTLSAVRIAGWFGKNQFWLAVQRYVMGVVLRALAIKLISTQRSPA